MIALEAVSKRFDAVAAVRDVSLIAPNGRITALLGPNGAGKSTTLRLLCGVLRADTGRALIDGLDVAVNPLAARARLGVLPHGAGLYPLLTARENVRYFGRLLGMSGALLERRIDELTALLDMNDIADRRARGFSQGQRVKVALARALVHSPANLVLDEPTNGLDVLATRSLRVIIRRLRDAGHAILFTSHVMQEVAALCDDIVILDDGRIVGGGTPAALAAATPTGSLEDAFVAALGGCGIA